MVILSIPVNVAATENGTPALMADVIFFIASGVILTGGPTLLGPAVFPAALSCFFNFSPRGAIIAIIHIEIRQGNINFAARL